MILRTLFILLTIMVSWSFQSVFGAERDAQIGTFEQRIRDVKKKAVLPMIDVECHYGNMAVEKLIKKMDLNGVALTWLGPNEQAGSEQSLRLSGLHPDRFVPTTMHGDGKLWHGSDKGFLEKLVYDARSGRYFAMGEFEARHYPSNTNSRNVHMPVDSEAMQTVFGVSQETGIPFLLHHEAEDALLPELERMLAKYPKAKLIWCHAGRNRNPETWKRFTRVDTLRELLGRYPNLYFDIVQSKPGSKYDYTGHPDAVMYVWQRGTGMTLAPDWRALFEEFRDRFLFGSDVNAGRFDGYENVIETFRNVVFKSLSSETTEKIAFKNAWKMMTDREWTD